MISILRPHAAPAVLLTRGVSEQLKAPGNAKSDIYAHKTVREALNDGHRRKCCYCESKVSLDVEHFRPKVHYYWLAYTWDNLLLACRKCNELKGTRFPLEVENERANSAEDDHARESPLYLDPTVDQPDDHIRWHDEVAVGSSRRGEHMARELLNRKDLVLARWERLRTVKRLVNVCSSKDPQSAAEARTELEDMCRDGDSFSGMIRAYLANL